MKRILLAVLIFMFMPVSFKAVTFQSPAPLTVTIAQASCDEFHGGGGCDCRFSVFHPCCPWWEPWQCAPTKERKKQVAAYVENYAKRRGVDILAIGGALRFIPGAGNAVGNVIGPVALALAVYAERSGDVRKDPFRWDFLEFYGGGEWPSAESLGMQYTGWYWNDQLVGMAQGVTYYADYITNEADRFTSCKQMGLDCPEWYAERHKENVAWGMWMFGWYHGALGDHLWNLAALVEQEGLSDPALLDYIVSVFREIAITADNAEQEYQNDWD